MFSETELYIIKASLEIITNDENPKTGTVWDIKEKMEDSGYKTEKLEFVRAFNELKQKGYLEEHSYGLEKVMYFYTPNMKKPEIVEAINKLGYDVEKIESFINSYVEKRSSVKK